VESAGVRIGGVEGIRIVAVVWMRCRVPARQPRKRGVVKLAVV